MELLFIVLLLAIFCACNIICFLIGTKVWQQVQKGEPITLPSLNPIKAIKEHLDRKETQRELERMDVIIQNIEGYDGTSNGQKDVPGR